MPKSNKIRDLPLCVRVRVRACLYVCLWVCVCVCVYIYIYTACIKMIRAVPWFNPLWLLPLGLREGQSVFAITACEPIWFEERNYRGYGDHHTWLADQSMAGIGLPPWCVPCDEDCTHRTFVGMYHKLAELLFRFY